MRTKNPLVAGVGINDMPGWSTSTDLFKHFAFNKWRNMVQRCYNGRDSAYDNVTVCDRWLTFSNFVKDLHKVTGYKRVSSNGFKGFHLDKDIYYKENYGVNYSGPKVYSLETCKFVLAEENIRDKNERNGNPTPSRCVVVIDLNGTVLKFKSLKSCSDIFHTSTGNISHACNATYGRHTLTRGKYRGWSFYWEDEYNKQILSALSS